MISNYLYNTTCRCKLPQISHGAKCSSASRTSILFGLFDTEPFAKPESIEHYTKPAHSNLSTLPTKASLLNFGNSVTNYTHGSVNLDLRPFLEA
jgi:hypothetical protein